MKLTAFTAMACGAAPAATVFQDLHDFTGSASDGDTPYPELSPDSEGRYTESPSMEAPSVMGRCIA